MSYERVSAAIRFAVEKHEGDYRDGDFGLPYITHPLEVTNLLRYTGDVTDEDMLCAAVMHDVLEETSTPSSEIETLFGKRTSLLVIELTRMEPGPDQTANLTKEQVWELRSTIMLSEIELMSPEAMAIKLADRLANLRQAKVTRTGEKLNRYVRQTKKILKIIPKKINPNLWRAIEAELDTI